MTCLNPNTTERAKSVFIQVFLSAPTPAPDSVPAPASAPVPAPAPAPAPAPVRRPDEIIGRNHSDSLGEESPRGTVWKFGRGQGHNKLCEAQGLGHVWWLLGTSTEQEGEEDALSFC